MYKITIEIELTENGHFSLAQDGPPFVPNLGKNILNRLVNTNVVGDCAKSISVTVQDVIDHYHVNSLQGGSLNQ